MEPIERLVMVYDADGGVVGEVRYAVGHLLGRPKAAFEDLLASLPVPVDVVHRNEQAPAVADATRGRLPCVAARSGGTWSILLGPEVLASCGGDVACLGDRLSRRPRRPGRHVTGGQGAADHMSML